MAKFNITVDLDFLDEDWNIDDELWDAVKSEVVANAAKSVNDKMMAEIENAVAKEVGGVDQLICDRLNKLMDEFFNEKKTITDGYGDVIKTDFCIRDKLKESCDNFLTQKVNDSGKPDSSYYAKQTRLDYIINKAVDFNMEYEIKSAVDKVVKGIKESVSQIITEQMSEKLRAVTGIDEIIKNL